MVDGSCPGLHVTAQKDLIIDDSAIIDKQSAELILAKICKATTLTSCSSLSL